MSLEYIINRLLSLDQNLTNLLLPLDKKNIALSCNEFKNTTIYCNFDYKAVHLSSIAPEHIDLQISGPLSGFIKLAIQKQNTDLRAQNIKIHGDVLLAEQLQALFFRLDIDWEEQLSKLTGDIIAHSVANALSGIKRYLQDAKPNLEQMVTEYLQEETRILPTHYELNEFVQAVYDLRLDVDRLEARMSAHENV